MDAATISSWMREIDTSVRVERDHLVQLDAAIGDGDHGTNMKRGFEAVVQALGADNGSPPGRLLIIAGRTLVSTVGGASGPLWGSALRSGGRVLGDQTTFDGAHALTACVLGFHMASLWEIFNVSVLEYDTSLGATMDDSGSGPPADVLGWIRTGFNSNGGDPLRARLTAACGHRVRPPTAAALSLWNPFGTRLP